MPETDSAAQVGRYLDVIPSGSRARLKRIRALARAAAPGAEDLFSYRMPALRYGGRILIYYAAFKKHVGIFPPIRGHEALMRAGARYRGPKGNLQLPLDEPLPEALLKRLFKYRAAQLRPAAKGASAGRAAP